MSREDIVPLIKQKIPTIVGFDREAQLNTIGDAARRIGLDGKTTVFNFKPAFGQGDKDFSGTKKYWYWIPETAEHPQKTETFTAKEASQRFLQTLFQGVDIPDKLIVGEPAIRDQTWKENFRRHMREVFSGLGLSEPAFFPEPFAVFQYYRHVDKSLPVANRAELVLIIDIGGGTFNSCIIRTTEQGLLARGGATAVPLGLQADVCGGSEIDRELLKVLVAKCHDIAWKENPLKRAEFVGGSALLRIEDAKIRLSEEISRLSEARLAADYSHIKIEVKFPKGELHADRDIRQSLTGEDLKGVVREMWRRHYGSIINATVNEAREKLFSALQLPLDRIDRVLIAGGSSRLPFTQEEVALVLPTLVAKNNIHIGSDIGEAVAFGIACECREQAKRDPQLSTDKLSPCILNDLYIAFRQSRRGTFETPHISKDGASLDNGQLLSAPFETEAMIQSYELELPFDVHESLLYYFSTSPFVDDPPTTYLNLTHDVFSLPPLKKISKTCTLTLDIQPNGLIRPTFRFRGKGDSASKAGEAVECPEFYVEGFQLKEGKTYIGLDFGNSNSYFVRFASFSQEIFGAKYPEFTLRPAVKDRLRTLELKQAELEYKAALEPSHLLVHAQNQMLDFIFHSNKIEGNPLSKGETEAAVSCEDVAALDAKEREAKNLEIAYTWVLDNYDACMQTPEAFIRHLNQTILSGLERDAGEYRKGPVKLSGMNFEPPPASSVPALMQQLAEELRSGGSDRSGLEFAAAMHTKLVYIHPFNDGNGRTARLLMNACLLTRGLPVLVVNYADKERYLYCLDQSNRGDLSALVEFMVDCFDQQMANLLSPPVSSSEESAIVASLTAVATEADPIVTVLEDTGVVEPEDPLTVIMKTKIVERHRRIEAEYNAWQQSILTVPAEFRAVAEAFNANESYIRLGYRMNCHIYDLLTIEKYIDIASGRSVPRTWFVGIEIIGPTAREKVMCFFNPASRFLRQDTTTSKVSLAISRFDGTRYMRLASEPVNLREIGYRQGTLLFITRAHTVEEGNIRTELRKFLADMIKAYF